MFKFTLVLVAVTVALVACTPVSRTILHTFIDNKVGSSLSEIDSNMKRWNNNGIISNTHLNQLTDDELAQIRPNPLVFIYPNMDYITYENMPKLIKMDNRIAVNHIDTMDQLAEDIVNFLRNYVKEVIERREFEKA